MDEGLGNALGGLLSQLVKVTAGIAGVAAITSGVIQGFKTLVGAVVQIGSVIKDVLFKAISAFVDVMKTSVKLAAPMIAAFTALGVVSGGLVLAFGVAAAGITAAAVLIIEVFKNLPKIISLVITSLTNLVDATAKIVTGILSLGAAAAPGGMQVFAQSMQYLTTVIGSVVAPVFTALTAIILSVADYLKSSFMAAMETVAKWMGDNLASTISDVVKGFVGFIQKVDEYGTMFVNIIDTVITGLLNFKDKIAIVADYIAATWYAVMSGLHAAMGRLEKALSFLPGFSKERANDFQSRADEEMKKASGYAKDIGDRNTAIDRRTNASENRKREREEASQARRDTLEGIKAPGGAIDATIQNIMKSVGGNMVEAVKTMRMELGKKGNVGFSGIADVAKQIQMQAFQSSIEQRTLDTQLKILNVLEVMAARGLNRAAPANGLAP